MKYFYHPIPWLLLSCLCLAFGIAETSEPDKSSLYFFSLLSFIFAIVWRWITNPKNAQSYLARRTMQNKWRQKSSQQENRSFTITDTEFIFTTNVLELAWKWQALKHIFESNKGFLLFFFIGHKQYIPKRILTQKEIDIFRNIMKLAIEKNNKKR